MLCYRQLDTPFYFRAKNDSAGYSLLIGRTNTKEVSETSEKILL